MITDLIKNANILTPDNDIRIDEARFKKISNELVVYFVLKDSIPLSTYKELKRKISSILDELKIKYDISFGYENEDLSVDELREYLTECLNNLINCSARFRALSIDECEIEGNEVRFLIAYDASGFDGVCKSVEDEIAKYGYQINVSIKQDENKSIRAQIAELDKQIDQKLEAQRKEAAAANNFNKVANDKKKSYVKIDSSIISPIKSIPSTQTELDFYINQNGDPSFTIQGYVFGVEVRGFAGKKTKLAVIKLTDETDSIMVKKWLRAEEEIDLYENQIKPNMELKISGIAEFDNYQHDVVITARNVMCMGKKPEEEVVDDEPVKRVELHIHTKMSELDGLSDATEYISLAKKLGHKAIAITDHNGVYAIPDVNHACGDGKDIKPIYGVELNYVDDTDFHVTFDKQDIELKEASYVVFDLETTGLSQTYDRIIEIAAVKMQHGAEVSRFECFVNPEIPISEKITKLTTITEDMVKDAKTIEEILPDFLEFCRGSILVAHNAVFDVNVIYANMRRLNYPEEKFATIDSLVLFRSLYYDQVKHFGLAPMSKFFKVKEEQHHRAIDDTRVTALCFLQILQEVSKRGITNYKDLDNCIDENYYKYVFTKHINILAKTQDGYKNMYKVLSDALTVHCTGEARLLKSVLNQYREGLLIGSGCYNGEIFQTALYGDRTTLKERMKYYDYIEVQPPMCYSQYSGEVINGDFQIKDTIKFIIETAKSIGKLVVATSDCHYLRPNMKKYRDILVDCPQVGGGFHELRNCATMPDMHYRTTKEMLDEFNFLPKDIAYEIVVTNTNLVADSTDVIKCFHKEMFVPADDEFKDTMNIPSMIGAMKQIVHDNVLKTYGEHPHPIVTKRVERELTSIISSGYYSTYFMAYLLVNKSLSDGYLVGSRGSVGSSLVATMMMITEINPLVPHYVCPKCHFQAFRMTDEEKQEYGVNENEAKVMPLLDGSEDGFDLADAYCPCCGAKLIKNGHDIPFETFLGFNGDKIPDIDLNFSGEYQAKAHLFVRQLMGNEYAFRGGTVACIQDKNAYGYVKGYCERKNLVMRSCEMERLASKLIGIKRSTGQHPGGIVVVPHRVDIYDVTPIQYPANKIDNEWRTTHFDYHAFEDNLLKLDILGHDDPTLIHYFMEYVHKHQDKFPFDNPQDIPADDSRIFQLFGGTDIINVKPEDINSTVASFAVPELGTNFVRQMLEDTKPNTFAKLIKISGLSHGTDVWLNNAQDLVLGKTEFGTISFDDIIGCRDDIMVGLIAKGCDPLKSFKIMEFVRKGKVAKDPKSWADFKSYLVEKKVPEWYVWSCEKIKYLFPKAHATAYVLMAMRIAWFKVYSPALFYSAWFSKRASAWDIQSFLQGPLAIKNKLKELESKAGKTAKDDDLITSLQVALEMESRGLKFLPLDIEKSEALIFTVVDDNSIRIPFLAVDKLGESVALDIVAKREERPFTSIKDVATRTKLNQSLVEDFISMHAFGNLPQEDPEEEVGIFALLE